MVCNFRNLVLTLVCTIALLDSASVWADDTPAPAPVPPAPAVVAPAVTVISSPLTAYVPSSTAVLVGVD